MANTCDPRKTGCDCYPFPHRKNSHPDRKCQYRMMMSFNLGHGMFATPDTIWSVSAPLDRWIPNNYINNTNRNVFKCILTPVLKQDA